MALGESLEDYLESILVLSQCIDKVRSVDVASYLGFSKPSVSHAVKLMVEQDLISLDANKIITLTPSGLQIAQETYKRHVFFTEFLTSIGVPRDIASEDACRLEHAISKESFEAIQKYCETKE